VLEAGLGQRPQAGSTNEATTIGSAWAVGIRSAPASPVVHGTRRGSFSAAARYQVKRIAVPLIAGGPAGKRGFFFAVRRPGAMLLTDAGGELMKCPTIGPVDAEHRNELLRLLYADDTAVIDEAVEAMVEAGDPAFVEPLLEASALLDEQAEIADHVQWVLIEAERTGSEMAAEIRRRDAERNDPSRQRYHSATTPPRDRPA
jgi:hypothetical protein